MTAEDFAAEATPTYPVASALRAGVPPQLQGEARLAGRIVLTRDDGPAVRFMLDRWPPGPRGTWYAKLHADGRTFTGYAGGHAPRGGGVPGLSASGVRRAVEAVDRQRRRWASGEAQPRPRGPVCPTCGWPRPLAEGPIR